MIPFSLFLGKKNTFHFHWNVFLYYGTDISIVSLIPEWLNACHVLCFCLSFCLPLFPAINQICFRPLHLYSACCSPLKFLQLLCCGTSVINVAILLKNLLPMKQKEELQIMGNVKAHKKI